MRLAIIAVTVTSLALDAAAAAEPPNKPVFLQQDNNADIAYCAIVLNDGRHAPQKDWNTAIRNTSTVAYLWTVLQQRSGKTAEELDREITPWAKKAVEDDVVAAGVPRLSAQACLDLADALPRKPESIAPERRITL